MCLMDTSSIPKIGFKETGSGVEFEVLKLAELFAQKDCLPVDIEQPHRVYFHHVFFMTAGEGSHHIDFVSYPFSPGTLLYIAQGQVHSFDIQPGTDGYAVFFTTRFLKENLIHSDTPSFSRLYNYQLYEPVLQPTEFDGEEFLTLFSEIAREYGRLRLSGAEEILRLLLKVLLLKLERVKPTGVAGQTKAEWLARFERFRDCLGKHYLSTRKVRDYADMLRVSPKHFNTICKSVAGTTAKQCIDDFLILEVRRVLATSADSVQELAYAFGFDEPTNFVKYFKKHTGQTPAQFRALFTK